MWLLMQVEVCMAIAALENSLLFPMPPDGLCPAATQEPGLWAEQSVSGQEENQWEK